MIVLFTCNGSGGILQFTIQIMHELKKLNIEVCCFVPEHARRYLKDEYMDDFVLYENFRSSKYQAKKIEGIGNSILCKQPRLVWYMDNLSKSLFVGLYLAGRVKQMLVLHDVHPHPSYAKGIKKQITEIYINFFTQRFLRKVDYLMLLSDESYDLGVKTFPRYADKMVKLTLSAHLPETSPTELQELSTLEEPFLLFFGRLDRYKGISAMLRAYALSGQGSERLVIAGNGILTEEEEKLIAENKKVILVKRYIEDCEMVWLFQHAQAAVLPYIEASQSGIIPIAYMYGVPVITSDVGGLVQYVEDKKTGIICREINDYVEAFQTVSQREVREEMSSHCRAYYKEHMDWQKNLRELLDIVMQE